MAFSIDLFKTVKQLRAERDPTFLKTKFESLVE